jgi:hypothetical protein
MADNYLEKRYEDYLVKKAEWERKRKLGLIPKKPVQSPTSTFSSESEKKDEKENK